MDITIPSTPTPTLTALADEIRSEHEHVGAAMRSALVHAMRVGELLIEAKAQIGHGGWLPWLEEHCGLAERTAQAYMRLSRDRARLDPQRVADLSVREALALLAEPKAATRGPYQVMPPMTPAEYQTLKASIAAHGVLVPVVLDEVGAILDGHERIRACRELGITEYPRLLKAGLTEEEKRAYSYSVNLSRGHYSSDQLAAVAADVEAADEAEPVPRVRNKSAFQYLSEPPGAESTAVRTERARDTLEISAPGIETRSKYREFLSTRSALATIRDRHLYRETHASFEDYLRERWGSPVPETLAWLNDPAVRVRAEYMAEITDLAPGGVSA